MQDGLEDKIRGVGHWRVNVRPIRPVEEKLSLQQCSDVVDKSRVSLRGWDYPHVNRNNEHGGQALVGEYVENWCDWYVHSEFWRMYRSTQFIHYKALTEDLSDDGQNKPEGRALSILGAIYSIIEMVEFTSRLHRAGLYAAGAKLNVTLGQTEGRQLWISDPMRMPFLDAKTSGAPSITIERELSPEGLSESPIDQALAMILELFDHFGWNPHPSQIHADQVKFYNREL